MNTMIKVFALLLLGSAHMAQSQTQGDLNAQTESEWRAADKQLNSIYQQIIAENADDEVFLASLKEAQRCWIAFRDAQLKMKYPDREPGYYGSVLPSCEMMYLTELTQDRIKALQVWIDGVEEGNICAGTVKIKE
jgi:uncharacterized protein YecT (DUF1311 family)